MTGSNVDPRELDRDFGARMRAARERQGLSQQGIAEALDSRYGVRWYQTTVGKVESGERPVKLSEAVAVAQVLGMLLEDLIYEPHEGEARYQQGIGRAKAELEAVRQSIEARIDKLDHESLVDIFHKAQRRWEAKERDDG